MKCCKEFLLPGGKQIPFCAYNSVGYREQARQQLDNMEAQRKQSRRDGIPYAVKPVVFDMKVKSSRANSTTLQQIQFEEAR